ncbi:EAL and HDOD domain-containing protein [Uliginosibacterium sp. H1]|uniref:EAL and HDOD domain-containing protein n=1 Tax=Uliginosibacterium sp. H1 TaxID=3114757 RepID=UPI002E193532|nr:HDOD domain-containing protein [Uliginosibacterium sp. H1]
MSADVLITREPVVNKQRAITANRLIVHAPSIPVAVEALHELSDYWPGRHSVFLSLAKLVPTTDLLQWQRPDNALVEIPAQALQYAQTQELISQLNQAGVPLNLTWFQPGAQWPAGVDCRFVLSDVMRVPKAAPSPGLNLAWGVSDVAGFDAAIANGYLGAAGWFFLKGVPQAKEMQPSHAQIVRLLNLVRNEAELSQIEAALKQDVTLSFKLLKYINSAGFGLMAEVQSFKHAVTILGMDKLNKWLSLLLVSASRDPIAPAVMQAAIARGRFMEILGAQYVDKRELDNLFITGAFSLLNVLLGADLDGVLEQMTLPEAITDALLRNEGPYAALLQLAIASEGFSPDKLRAQAESLGLTPAQVSAALMQAVAFADALGFD